MANTDKREQLVDPDDIKTYYASPEVVDSYERERFSGADRLKQANELRAVRWMLDKRQGACVWEVASGTGRLGRAAARLGHQVVCLDYSQPMLTYSRDQAEQCSGRPIGWVRGDAFHLPMRDASVDACICFRFLRHFADDERAELWRELNRVLKPGGYLALDVPNAEWHRDRQERFIYDQAYSLAEFGREVAAHGLRPVRVWGNGYIPLSRRPLQPLWRLGPLVTLRSWFEFALLSRVPAWHRQAFLWSVVCQKC